jgi:hypothetical protein
MAVRVLALVVSLDVVPMRPGVGMAVRVELVLRPVVVPEALRTEHESRYGADPDQHATRCGQKPA